MMTWLLLVPYFSIRFLSWAWVMSGGRNDIGDFGESFIIYCPHKVRICNTIVIQTSISANELRSNCIEVGQVLYTLIA